MKTKNVMISILLVAVAILSSCKKGDTGDTGPAGPVGPTGATGSAGVKSQIINVLPNEWYHIGIAGHPEEGYQVDEPCSLVTAEIISSGAVMAYVSTDNNNWMLMPFTLQTGQGGSYHYAESWNLIISENEISVQIKDSDWQTMFPTVLYEIKIVAISASARLANPRLNYKNYEEVKTAFNLQD